MSLYALGPSYVSRADEKIAKRKAKEHQTRDAYAQVDARDKFICRACGCRCVKSLTLQPRRWERHHILGRRGKNPHQTDRIVGLCFRDHDRITRNLLSVEGNADAWLTFSENGRTWKG